MKSNISKLFILVLLAAVLSCQKENRSNPITDTDPEKQAAVKALLEEIFTVAKSKDMDSLDSYHLRGPKFSKFDDGEIPGRQDYEMGKKTESEFFTGVNAFNFTLPDTKVDVFDDVAIATFIIEYNVVLNDTTVAGQSRGTLVFVDDSGRWKITHEHFSPVVGGQ